MHGHGKWHFSWATRMSGLSVNGARVPKIEKSYLQRSVGVKSSGLLGKGLACEDRE